MISIRRATVTLGWLFASLVACERDGASAGISAGGDAGRGVVELAANGGSGSGTGAGPAAAGGNATGGGSSGGGTPTVNTNAGRSGSGVEAGSAGADRAGSPAPETGGTSGSAARGGSAGAPAADGGAPAPAAGGGVATAAPSAGCAKAAGRPQAGTITQPDRIYSFPAAYDGETPFPLLLALHAAGNPNSQLLNLTKGSRLETEFIRIFPKSAGSAWVYDTDIAKLNSVLDDVLANHCIDTQRMFATGHSSGAQMVVQLLCKGEKRFRAVAPVAASKYCAKFSPIPVIYIQGMMDAQRGGGNGADVVGMFTASNGCGSMTSPNSDVASCTSTFDRMPVTPGCVSYRDCKAPSVWCSHDDNGYNNTDGRQHGWPCFASTAIADFFLNLPATAPLP